MSATQRKEKVFTNLRGRDGSTPSDIAIPPSRAKDMVNVDLYRAAFARKRNGCENAFSDTTSEAFTGQLSALGRHVPAADETAAQLWGIDNAATPVVQYLTGGTAWATPTLKDNVQANAQDATFLTFAGKLYIFYNSAQDRLHVWDGSTVRRVGLATPAAPTVADTGSGSYAAVLRYYKVLYRNSSDSRYSEASAAQSFTPSGSGTHARITKPAAISEGETHWDIYASIDDRLYFLLAQVVVGTTTYDDNTAYTASSNPLSGNDAIPVAGANTVPTSAKFGVVDGNRILIAGSWESTYSSRIWFTPRSGSSDYNDSERIPATADLSYWLDVNEKDGDYITGIAGPIQGMPIVFKNRHIYKLVPTGDDDAPYVPLLISNKVGAIRHHSIVMAEDEHGDPAIYFWSHRGPYRLGMRGLQYCGLDVLDLHQRLNIDATTATSFGLWHEDRHQVWFYLALDSSNAPDTVAVFDTQIGEYVDDDSHGPTVRNGWTQFTGEVADARCGVMFAASFAATMPRTLLPYVGRNTGTVLLRCDTGVVDNGSEYAGMVTLPEQHLAGIRHTFLVDQAGVLGSAGQHNLRLNLIRDYGAEPRYADVPMSPETGDQTRVQKPWEAAFHADCKSIGMAVGDVCPTALTWEIDAIWIQYEPKKEIAL